MQKKYIKPQCEIVRLNSRGVVCQLSGGYGNSAGGEGEAGGGIKSDDIIDGGSF